MRKTAKSGAKLETKARLYYALHPWRWERRGECCEVRAYVEASGSWETVALIQPTSGASADSLASFIVARINNNQAEVDALQAAQEALEAVVQEGLTFTTEQEAEHVIDRLKKRLARSPNLRRQARQ